MEGAVRCDSVTRRWPDGTLALDRLSLEARAGEVVAVVGPSGAGKSTLLELICGLQAPDAGSVECAGAVLMPQRDSLLPWLDAAANAALPLRISGVGARAARSRAAALLCELGLSGYERARITELSGGMRQRVAFARTLLAGRPVLCLDEPFGALDALTRAETHRWLAGVLAQSPRTVLLVTHDVDEAALLADRILVMSPRPGRITTGIELTSPRGPQGRDPRDDDVLAARAEALVALGAPAMAGGR